MDQVFGARIGARNERKILFLIGVQRERLAGKVQPGEARFGLELDGGKAWRRRLPGARREGTSRVLRVRSVGSVGRLGRGSLELCLRQQPSRMSEESTFVLGSEPGCGVKARWLSFNLVKIFESQCCDPFWPFVGGVSPSAWASLLLPRSWGFC